MTLNPLVKTYALHLLKLIGLAASGVVVVWLIQLLPGIDLSKVPPEYSGLLALLIPTVVTWLKNVEVQIELDAQKEQNAKLTADLAKAITPPPSQVTPAKLAPTGKLTAVKNKRK